MNEIIPTPEVDVLIATCLWLHSHKWKILQISVSIQVGRRYNIDVEHVKQKLSEAGVPTKDKDVRFVQRGTDIIAQKGVITFKIECKGLGKGATGTLMDHFRRAFTSSVCYFNGSKNLQIGMAMPLNKTYLNLISKIPKALIEVTNMWNLIYNPESERICPLSPEKLCELPDDNRAKAIQAYVMKLTRCS